jgi:uncharacterized protein GlcG (DUF336 family)
MASLTRAGVREMLEAAVQEATRLGRQMALAVVDAGGHLLAAERMDGAPWFFLEVAMAKAYTAAAMQQDTATAGQKLGSNAYWQTVPYFLAGRLVLGGGGIPIRDATGAVVGAVGVSGGTGEEDHQCAEAALKAWAG